MCPLPDPIPILPRAQGFAAVADRDARVLVLGSMPGLASLRAGHYYAHPRNLFWPFMGELVDAQPALAYDLRCQRLMAAGVALWDVLGSCERAGSLDSAIRDDSARANDFNAFFARHRAVAVVLFNGAKAESSFRRQVAPSLQRDDLAYRRLPSTSPANAAQRPADKLAAWRDALRAAGIDIRA